MKKAILIAIIQFRKTIFSLRALSVCLIVAPYLFVQIRPIVNMCIELGFSCNPFLFPFIMSDLYSRLFICSGAIILLCDAPFIDGNQPYILLRTGKANWFIGVALYVIMISVFYILFITLICFISIIPFLAFDFNWGKIVSTLSATDAGSYFGVGIYVSRFITLNFSVFQAMLLSSFVALLVFTFFGSLLLLANLKLNRVLGVIICGSFVVLSAFVQEAFNTMLFYLSPVSWLSIDQMSINGLTRRPPMIYCYTFLVVLNFLLFLFSYSFIKKDSIEIEYDKYEV